MTGSPMLHAFRIPARVDYVKLPCLARTRDGAYTVKYLSMNYQDTVKLRSNLILSTVLDFQPDLILVDKKPFGVGNELAATLDVCQEFLDLSGFVAHELSAFLSRALNTLSALDGASGGRFRRPVSSSGVGLFLRGCSRPACAVRETRPARRWHSGVRVSWP